VWACNEVPVSGKFLRNSVESNARAADTYFVEKMGRKRYEEETILLVAMSGNRPRLTEKT